MFMYLDKKKNTLDKKFKDGHLLGTFIQLSQKASHLASSFSKIMLVLLLTN